MNTEMLLAAAICIPLLGGLVVLILPETLLRWLRPLTACAAAVLALICVVQVVAAVPLGGGLVRPLVINGHPLAWALGEGAGYAGPTLNVAFYLDRLSALVILAVAVIALLVMVYSWEALAGSARRGEFMAYALWALAGSILAVTSDNLLMMLIGWELVSVMLFYLITIGGDRARYPAGKALVMLGFGDGALLLGIVALFCAGGQYSLSLGELVRSKLAVGGFRGNSLAVIAYLLFVAAALVKAGAMPLHTWLPKAAEGAPSATMALLPASLDKLLGIYLLARASLFIFDWSQPAPASEALRWLGPQTLLMVLGAATVVLAVMAALAQHDLKRLLAFHAVSQVGYMMMGIATGTAIGVIGGVFHMLNHSIYKSTLFLCAGAIEKRAGTTELEHLGGLGRKMPGTFVSMLVASLAISGVPPLNGFMSKWLIYAGLLQYAFAPGHSAAATIFLVAAMFGSALTLASFVKVLHSAFMGPATRECRNAREVGALMSAPMLIMSAACVALGVVPYFVINNFLAPAAAEAGLSGGAGGVVAAAPHGFALSAGGYWNPLLAAGLIVVALGLGALVFLLGRFRKARVVRPFLSGETTMFTAEETRFPGTGFYGTVMELGVLGTVYRDAAEGAYDLYAIVGEAGGRLVELLRRVHNGVLPTYLGFCMVGLLVVLAALLIPLLVGG